jgi:hypothetical protein
LPTISLPSFSLNKSWKTALYGPHGDKVSVVDHPSYEIDSPILKSKVAISRNGLLIANPDWEIVVDPLTFLGAKLPSDKFEIAKGDDFISYKTPHFEFGLGFHGSMKMFLVLHKPIPGNSLEFHLNVCFNSVFILYSFPFSKFFIVFILFSYIIFI